MRSHSTGSPEAGGGGHHHGSWGIQPLWEVLNPLLPGLSIEVVDRLPSTNLALVDRLRDASRGTRDNRGRGLRSDDLRPTLLVAVDQTQGRGRLGRSWQSSAGASLTFSLALALERADWSGLSLAVGVALASALDPNGTHIGLKWPNDLWLQGTGPVGRKLGGILIEAIGLGDWRLYFLDRDRTRALTVAEKMQMGDGRSARIFAIGSAAAPNSPRWSGTPTSWEVRCSKRRSGSSGRTWPDTWATPGKCAARPAKRDGGCCAGASRGWRRFRRTSSASSISNRCGGRSWAA